MFHGACAEHIFKPCYKFMIGLMYKERTYIFILSHSCVDLVFCEPFSCCKINLFNCSSLKRKQQIFLLEFGFIAFLAMLPPSQAAFTQHDMPPPGSMLLCNALFKHDGHNIVYHQFIDPSSRLFYRVFLEIADEVSSYLFPQQQLSLL